MEKIFKKCDTCKYSSFLTKNFKINTGVYCRKIKYILPKNMYKKLKYCLDYEKKAWNIGKYII